MSDYVTALKTARLQLVVDYIDAGPSFGTLEIGTAGMATVLAIITLVDPSASVSGDTLTFSGLPIGTTAIAGGAGTNAVEARIKDSTGTDVMTGLTVGTSGTEVIIDNVSIATGQTVNFTAVSTIVHA